MWNDEIQGAGEPENYLSFSLVLIILILLSFRFWYLSVLQGDWYKQNQNKTGGGGGGGGNFFLFLPSEVAFMILIIKY